MTISATDVSRLHQAAIVARLRDQHPIADDSIYDGDVTTAEDSITYPYLVVWLGQATRQAVTMVGDGGDLATTTTQITAAGISPADVSAALDRAGKALHMWQPTIVGRSCGLVRQDPADAPPPPIRDPSVKTPAGGPVYIGRIFVRLTSTRDPSA